MDSFPAHAIIPSEVKDDTRIRGGGHSAFGSKMDRYEHHPMWCTMFAIAEGALAMAACFPAWGRQRSGWPARRTKL